MLIQKKIETKLRPHEIYARISPVCRNSFFLESAERDGQLSRHSFIGFKPEKTFSYKDGKARFDGHETLSEDPLGEMREILQKEAKGIFVPGFMGGFVGYASYDFAKTLEDIGSKNAFPGFPLLEFGLYRDGIRINNRTGEIYYVSMGRDRSAEVDGLLRSRKAQGRIKPLKTGSASCLFPRSEFEAAVLKAKEYIASGDIFQAVLSKQYELEFEGSLLDFYFRLREINPSPYMYYLKFGDRQIIGSSPENLVRVEGGRMDSFATLAGTRPRGKTQEGDRALEAELLADPKERAEHVMLVDLTRNDVGKVAEAGSVHVPDFMSVRKFSHVQHISSHVTALLRDGADAFDALKAIIPAGTLSGAPKIRAMQIIEELEPAARGPYGGAVGYFGFSGNADFGICIRTLVANGGKAYVQSGAGIVADSVPEKEYEETEHKARAMIRALEQASNPR